MGEVLGLALDTSGAVVSWASPGDVVGGLVWVGWCALYLSEEINWFLEWRWG